MRKPDDDYVIYSNKGGPPLPGRGDIRHYFPDAKVMRTERRDYLYRTVLPKELVAERIAKAVADIDYCGALGTGFKASVDKRRSRY